MKHRNAAFDKAEVVLDGNEYDGCTFISCTLVFSGGLPFGLRDNKISTDCRFEFRGAAANTVIAMRGIYSMGDWGRQHVLATFQTIAPDQKKMH